MTPEQIYAWCKDHKDELLAAQEAGDSNARTIIATHDMMVRYPDHIAFGILEMSVEERIKRQDKT